MNLALNNIAPLVYSSELCVSLGMDRIKDDNDDVLQLWNSCCNLVSGKLTNFLFYYTHFEITGDPCNLFSSQ